MARTKPATGLKADIISSATGKGKEPEWSMLAPPGKVQLARALSHYNADNYKSDDYKKWALAWISKNRPELLSVADEQKPYKFQTYGAIMRCESRGMILDENVEARLNKFLNGLKSVEKVDEDDASPKKPRKAKVNSISQAVDDALDDACKFWAPHVGITFEIDPSADPAPAIARCEEALEHFKEEGITQYPLHMKGWFKAVIAKLSTIKKITKTRAPRKKRKVNPIKMAAKVKFLKRAEDLKIDSRPPVDIVGKNKVYLYDTKYKKITKLVCGDASGFVIKGTTIQNFDAEKSAVTFLRKPQTELQQGQGVRELDRVMNSSKSKREAEAKGRINEYTLILQVI